MTISTPKLSDEEKKERQRASQKRYREKHPHRHRERHIKSRYGITYAQRDEMLSAQGGTCAICQSNHPRKGGQDWVVDHCHSTGRIRGILCHPCNVLLGHACDDKAVLEKAIKYLN